MTRATHIMPNSLPIMLCSSARGSIYLQGVKGPLQHLHMLPCQDYVNHYYYENTKVMYVEQGYLQARKCTMVAFKPAVNSELDYWNGGLLDMQGHFRTSPSDLVLKLLGGGVKRSGPRRHSCPPPPLNFWASHCMGGDQCQKLHIN